MTFALNAQDAIGPDRQEEQAGDSAPSVCHPKPHGSALYLGGAWVGGGDIKCGTCRSVPGRVQSTWSDAPRIHSCQTMSYTRSRGSSSYTTKTRAKREEIELEEGIPKCSVGRDPSISQGYIDLI